MKGKIPSEELLYYLSYRPVIQGDVGKVPTTAISRINKSTDTLKKPLYPARVCRHDRKIPQVSPEMAEWWRT